MSNALTVFDGTRELGKKKKDLFSINVPQKEKRGFERL